MSATASVLAAYGLYVLVLVIGVAVFRTQLVMTGQRRANSFAPDCTDVSTFGQRLGRVHANAYESFPWIAAPLLVALATDRTEVTDPLAWWLLAARLGQAITHLGSTRELAVYVRFAFMLAQVAIAANWAVRLLQG
ncbi:MAG: MAPEG family protein [Pseudomonadota bacterium]